MKRIFQILTLIFVTALCLAAQDKQASEPQQPKPERPLSVYKVEYVLRELQDGKNINSRTYSMNIENERSGDAKVGARVPVSTGHEAFQYIDIGINIHCRVVAKDDYVSLDTTFDISNFALPEQSSGGTNPVIRGMRTSLISAVPIGKQTVIGDMDDASSTKRYEIAVTVTKLK